MRRSWIVLLEDLRKYASAQPLCRWLFNSLVYVCEVGHASDERAAFCVISKGETKGTEEGFFFLTV